MRMPQGVIGGRQIKGIVHRLAASRHRKGTNLGDPVGLGVIRARLSVNGKVGWSLCPRCFRNDREWVDYAKQRREATIKQADQSREKLQSIKVGQVKQRETQRKKKEKKEEPVVKNNTVQLSLFPGGRIRMKKLSGGWKCPVCGGKSSGFSAPLVHKENCQVYAEEGWDGRQAVDHHQD